MRDWDTDKIIGAGLIAALIFYLSVVGVIAFFNGVVLPLDVAGNIVTGLAGYMGRSLAEKLKKDKQSSDDS